MKEDMKKQKELYKLKNAPKPPFKSDTTILDVFSKLNGAHECVTPTFKFQGILQFLTLKDIGRLSIVCNNLKEMITESKVLLHPRHVGIKNVIINSFQNRCAVLRAKELRQLKYNVGMRAYTRLIHVHPNNQRGRDKILKEIKIAWRLRFGRRLRSIVANGLEYGGYVENHDDDSDDSD